MRLGETRGTVESPEIGVEEFEVTIVASNMFEKMVV
jgi:hypothetical protein